MGSRSSEKEHIVMLPYMAHGHLIPFLALANQIHRRTGFTITIANTPLNIAYLRRSSSATGPIRFVALPFNSSDHGLPPNTENTEALPLPLIVTLFHSSTALEAPTLELIADITAADGRPPICIISDIFFGWATRVAEQSGTVNVSFTTGGGYGTAAYVSVWQNLPHREIVADGGDEEFTIPGFPDRCRVRPSELHQFVRIADGNDPWSQFFRPQISLSLKSFGWLCNTAEEIEPMGLEILRNFTNRPVWSIGPIPPRSGGRHGGRESGISPEKCLDWLDSYPEASVLFISFGSQNTISPTQMMELAKGLEESNKPFIWVIRPPIGFDPKAEFDAGKWLPPGFENRAQGLLVRGWAPQVEILCHKSTGAFLSHCGWNSTVESLSQGVTIIGWPLAAEQVNNCKMMEEEMGVCVELCNGVQGKVERGDVKRAVELVLGEGEKGREMKKKAVEIGEMIRAALREDGGDEGFQKGSSLQAMDDFVSAILSAKKEREGEMKI